MTQDKCTLQYRNASFPFAEGTDNNAPFCKIFKEVYTSTEISKLELLYFEVNKEERKINFQIGVVTKEDDAESIDNITNVIWMFGLEYSDTEDYLLSHGNQGSLGYVVIDIAEALKLRAPLWHNFKEVKKDGDNKVYRHYVSRPEYLLDSKVIADVNDSPRIKDEIIGDHCRYVSNYPIDQNIVEMYVEQQGRWEQLEIVQKQQDGGYIKSYISQDELNFFIKEKGSDNIYQLYATNCHDPYPKGTFDFVTRTFTDGNRSFTVRIIFRYAWTPIIADAESFEIKNLVYDLQANQHISSFLKNAEVLQDTVSDCENLRSELNSRLNKLDVWAEGLTSTIPEGSITEKKLSDDVKNLISASHNNTIINQPDGYFLCSNKENRLTIADRPRGTYEKRLGFVAEGESALTGEIKEHTIYLITADVDLQGKTLTLKPGTCLMFRGGSIRNGTIVGNGSLIDASEYRVFYDGVKLVGSFSNQFPVEWWGALSTADVDSSAAINAATSSGALNIVGHGDNYYIKSTIFVNKMYTSLHFDGNIVAQFVYTEEAFYDDNPDCSDYEKKVELNTKAAIEVTVSHVSIKMKGIISQYRTPIKVYDETYDAFPSVGLRLSRNCHHGTFNIDYIEKFRMGILLQPRTDAENETAGIQYCKFSFQLLANIENLVFDLKGDDLGKDLWINENQFFGGRIGDQNADESWPRYGIIFKGERADKGKKHYDQVNGNVFRNIGFEAICYPIHDLWEWVNDKFYDIRMSESVYKPIYISMGKCENLTFSIKSVVFPYREEELIGENRDKNFPNYDFNAVSADNQCRDIVVKDTEFTIIYNNTTKKFAHFRTGDITEFLGKNIYPDTDDKKDGGDKEYNKENNG